MQQKDLNRFLEVVESARRARKEADDGSIFDGEQGAYIDKLLNAMGIIEDKLVMALSQRVGWKPGTDGEKDPDTLLYLYRRLAKYLA